MLNISFEDGLYDRDIKNAVVIIAVIEIIMMKSFIGVSVNPANLVLAVILAGLILWVCD